MELKTVRKEMNASDQLISITVSPVEKKLSDEEIAAIWRRIEGYWAGVKVDKSKTLDDWRKERLEERYGIKFAD